MLLGEGRDRNHPIYAMEVQDVDVFESGKGVVVEVIARKAYWRVKLSCLNSIAIYDCCGGVKR
jgi:hypothetical protein